MSTSVREDCLEAILTLAGDNGRPVGEAGIRGAVDADAAEITAALHALLADGDVVQAEKGYMLTPKGKPVAESVLRKHRVLACFLSEMLGMEREAASKQACVLEHGVTDETIDRLSTYIQNPGRHRPMRHHVHGVTDETIDRLSTSLQNPGRHWSMRHHVHGGARHTLLDFAEGDTVEVTMIRCASKNRRLFDLGIFPGELIGLRRKLGNNAVVVSVKGADIALSPEIASTIFAEKTA